MIDSVAHLLRRIAAKVRDRRGGPAGHKSRCLLPPTDVDRLGIRTGPADADIFVV